MSEHFGLRDIWVVLKKNKFLIIVFISVFFIIFGFMSLKTISNTIQTGNFEDKKMFISSIHYIVQPDIESLKSKEVEKDFYRSIPDDFTAVLNSDECLNYIYSNLSSLYSIDYLMDNTKLSLNKEELKNINIEAFKSIYKAQREKNTMIIKLYAFSYEPELSKSILSICKNYINEKVKNKIKYVSLEESTEIIKEAKADSNFEDNDDLSSVNLINSNNSMSSSSKYKSIIKIVIKNLIIPLTAVTLLLILLLIWISFINPTMNRKSDFCEYNVPILGEIEE